MKKIVLAVSAILLLASSGTALSHADDHWNMSPRKQAEAGVSPENVVCKDGMQLMIKNSDGGAVCVSASSVEAMTDRGFATTVAGAKTVSQVMLPVAGVDPEQQQQPAAGMDPEQQQQPAAGMDPEQQQQPAAGMDPEQQQQQQPAAGMDPEQQQQQQQPAAGMDPELSGQAALPETVAIGGLLPMTGERANRGEDYKTAITLAEDDFNEYLGGIGAGWTLDVVIEDSATNPVTALDKLMSLKAKNIDIVIGPQSSAELRNVMSYAGYNGMLLVSSGSTTPTLAIPGDNVYRLVPDDSTQGRVLAKLVYDSGITNIVPIWRGDAWGDGLKDVFASEYAGRGGNIDDGVRYSPEVSEFSTSASLLAQIVQTHADEGALEETAVLDMSFTEAVQIMQSASRHDILDDVQWYGASAIVKDSDLVEDKISQKFANGVGFTAMQFAPTKNPKYERVAGMMEAELGRVPNAYAFSTYDSVWIIGLAVLETQDTGMEAIRAAIPGTAAQYDGVIGSTRLNDAGDLANNNYELWTVDGSEWVLAGKYDSQTDSIVR